jgi:transposase
MAKKHPPYAPEFRRQMIELVRAGRSPEELAKEFEPSVQAIRNWVAQADRDAGRREDGLTTAEREELNRLRRENRQLKLEREILSNRRGSAPPVVSRGCVFWPVGSFSRTTLWRAR